VLLLLALLVVGCSPATVREEAQRLLARPAAVAATSVPPSDPGNRILLQGTDGNLYIASPDGKERFALTDDASGRRRYGQPTWAPDGERIAWNQITRRGTSLLTSRFDGSERTILDVPYLPFYIFWSPTGKQLAYLSNWQVVDEPSMALRLVDVDAEGKTVKTLAAGQPFYFSWSPDGNRLLAHIDGERVEVYDVTADEAQAQSLIISGGAFSAPQWSATGEQLVYAVADEQTQRLLLTDPAGQPLQDLTDYTGRVSFLLSPDSRHLAYVTTETETEASTLGPLYVMDVETLRTRELSAEPVLAFYWSPDGEKLAYLALDRVSGRIGLRWNVWDGQVTREYAGFFPTRELLQNYLPFFDQYAQSHRIWSPESDALVFAGTLENGRTGVWVQPVGDETVAPVSLGTGVLATWSPR
jgi:Tol biopolymer transport system component